MDHYFYFYNIMSKEDSRFNKKILNDLGAKRNWEPSEIMGLISQGNRLALSQAITIIESTITVDQQKAESIIGLAMPLSGKSLRIGITGVPGVGKSTFIEKLGLDLIARGKKVAVLAVDPTSQKSGGSILGDKTRMNLLSRENDAFIRPSPAADSLGGVAQKTRETIILCEAAGFDVILIETVGVGQSEIAVHSMVDFFLLLMLAGAGDELQGIKRGIMEMADALVINKADGENMPLAKKAKISYQNALHLFPPNKTNWQVPVQLISSVEGTGIDVLWSSIMKHEKMMKEKSVFLQKRKDQARFWLKKTIQEQLENRFYKNEKIKDQWSVIEKKVVDGALNPFQASRDLLNLL
jgi:LAO/AO transport system kinase